MTSPTLLRQVQALQRCPRPWPGMPTNRWIAGRRHRRNSPLACRLDMLPRIGDADVSSLDSAFPRCRAAADRAKPNLYGPAAVRRGTKDMLRLYAAEAAPTLTGANADHTLALAPAEIEHLACAIALRFGAGGVPNPTLSPEASHFADTVLADLQAHPGRARSLAGQRFRQTRRRSSIGSTPSSPLPSPISSQSRPATCSRACRSWRRR